MNIIPAIDLKDGACVRLFQGDFNQVTEYSNNPTDVARLFSSYGFDYLHIVDLDGALQGESRNRDTILDIIRATNMSVQVGGGIRTEESLQSWFDTGVDRCVIGSVAVSEVDMVQHWLRKFSPDRLVLALDVQLDVGGTPMLATHGWTRSSGITLWDCVDGYLSAGVMHVLCTDVGRDGALAGPNLDLYREFVQRYPTLALQASGGVRDIDDLKLAAAAGAAGTVTGRALLDGRISRQEIATFLQNA